MTDIAPSASESRPVLVGIDGSDAGAQALVWAADEAERRGIALHVAHAGDLAPLPDLSPGGEDRAPDAASAYGRQLLADAIATLAQDFPRLTVTATLREANPAALLTELSGGAALLVVGTRGHHRLAGLLLGSVSQRVAGHAHCPVVLLNERASDAAGDVVAGVSSSAAGRAALLLACEEASLRGVGVRAVRSMAEPVYSLAQYEDLDLGGERWRRCQRELLDECVAQAAAAYPDVKITPQLVGAPAHLALVDASAEAALLVVGCRRPEATYLSRLGPVASWLMHESPAPVALAGQSLQTAPAE